jgi:ATP:ADP antiporter, AAA family
MVTYILKRLYGNFSPEEIKKYTLLGITFGLLIAVYWGLHPLKDSIFQGIVGVDYTPYAKILSFISALGIIGIYGKLVDRLSRHKVFYVLTLTYALSALIFALILSNPHYGIPNTIESPLRIVGWLWYIFVESMATIMVPLFWAFAADVSTASSARRGFPLIMLCAQFGNIVGPWFLRARRLGFSNSSPVIVIAAILILLIGLLIWIFMHVIPKSEFHKTPHQKDHKDENPSFFEGLMLLIKNKYLLGIFVFLLSFEAITTLVDFYFIFKVKAAFPDEMMRSDYLATFAVITGLVSFFSLVFGISNIQRKLGMRASLITLPLLMSAGVIIWWFYPVMLVSGLVVVVFKGFNYALNQPSIKQLYIPTSKDTRYKAQAWIEAFGNRGSKTVGSSINALKLPLSNSFGPATGLSVYLGIACITSFGLLSLWIIIAFYVSTQYNKAIKDDTLVC